MRVGPRTGALSEPFPGAGRHGADYDTNPQANSRGQVQRSPVEAERFSCRGGLEWGDPGDSSSPVTSEKAERQTQRQQL